jgi:Bacteriophage abortive infection AbiH
MKTLITGNGFDLEHHLPTSYKEFINFVIALESYSSDKSQARFDEIFAEFDKPWLINVRKYYATEKMTFDLSIFKEKTNNVWLNYFKSINTIQTWIDFEKEIGIALETVADFFKFSSELLEKGKNLDHISTIPSNTFEGYPFYHNSKAKRLYRLGLLFGRERASPALNLNREYKFNDTDIGENAKNFTLKDICFDGIDKASSISLSKNKIVTNLLIQLNEFIELFGDYLKLITSEFFRYIDIDKLIKLNGYSEIFTFNYTKTVSSLHSNLNNATVRHLHGEIGKTNNIVLGVAAIDTNDEKALGVTSLGFCKYYQTLFKETKFSFLDEADYQSQINRGIDYFVWGHSLDRSDEKYIKRLFDELSSNSQYNANSTITVYFHSEDSKASLLKNLLSIIGKEIIEKSIRLKYLKFSLAPKIWKD